MPNKAFKYRIYPNSEQEILIQKTFGCVRFVYNHFLADRIAAYKESGESRTFFQQNKSLTALKHECEWLKEPDKYALQYALRDLNTAYQNFFRGCKGGACTGFPKFKSKKNDRKSYSTAANGNHVRLEEKAIRLPKLGSVKAKISRRIPEGHRILSATLSQNASGKYFVSVLTEYELDVRPVEVNKTLGLDYSSPRFYVDSEGNTADMPRFYREAEKRLARRTHLVLHGVRSHAGRLVGFVTSATAWRCPKCYGRNFSIPAPGCRCGWCGYQIPKNVGNDAEQDMR